MPRVPYAPCPSPDSNPHAYAYESKLRTMRPPRALSVCLSVRLSVCLPTYLPIHPSIHQKLLRNLHCCSVFYIPEKDNSPQCCLHPIDQVCYVTTVECVLAIFAVLRSAGCRSIPDYITSYTAYSGRMAQDTAPDTITQGAILGLEGGTSAVLARTNKVFSYNLIAPLICLLSAKCTESHAPTWSLYEVDDVMLF